MSLMLVAYSPSFTVLPSVIVPFPSKTLFSSISKLLCLAWKSQGLRWHLTSFCVTSLIIMYTCTVLSWAVCCFLKQQKMNLHVEFTLQGRCIQKCIEILYFRKKLNSVKEHTIISTFVLYIALPLQLSKLVQTTLFLFHYPVICEIIMYFFWYL